MKMTLYFIICTFGFFCGSDVASVDDCETPFVLTKRGDTTFAYLTLEQHSALSYSVDLHIEGDSVKWTTEYLDSNDNLIKSSGFSTTDWSNYSYSLDTNGYRLVDITLRNSEDPWEPVYYGKYRGVCTVERLGGNKRTKVEFKGIR
jgi:hypothetical protein